MLKIKSRTKIRAKIYTRIFAVVVCAFFLPEILFAAQSSNSSQTRSAQSQRIWEYQCIDTMKFSRDAARAWIRLPDVLERIDRQIAAIKSIGAGCVAIGTPYDSEFLGYLTLWINSARKNGLSVWFRGNFSGWEGWFDYTRFVDADEHNRKTYEFITGNPGIFRDGDIFTPAPEPENGIGNIWSSENKKKFFLDFLVSSYENCRSATAKIRKNIKCGYFSVNGDVARNILTSEVVNKTGNVVVVDHYVKDPGKLVNDLIELHKKFGAKIVLGEFGAPIPDIHGEMNQSQQADFIDKVLRNLFINKDIMGGLNYWVLKGGSTAILNDDDSLKQVASVMKGYYRPAVISGMVSNTLDDKLKHLEIKLNDISADSIVRTVTDDNGQYSLVAPYGEYKISAGGSGYKVVSVKVKITLGKNETIKQNFVLDPQRLSFVYALRLLIRQYGLLL